MTSGDTRVVFGVPQRAVIQIAKRREGWCYWRIYSLTRAHDRGLRRHVEVGKRQRSRGAGDKTVGKPTLCNKVRYEMARVRVNKERREADRVSC